MTLEEVAAKVIDSVEATGTQFMIVGAIAAGVHGLPRSTRDFGLLISVDHENAIDSVINQLSGFVEFDPQIVFDTITFGKRHVGKSDSKPSYKIEHFETFDDPFVASEFERRIRIKIPMLQRESWVPTAEDVIVQKLRWARPKDLEDARDVLFVQGEAIDMDYIRKWTSEHHSIAHLDRILDELPDFKED